MPYYNPTGYYPNYSPYNNYMTQQPQVQQQISPIMQQIQQQQQTINGKIVDSADMVKVAEVPIGAYGVFPKADLSEIYIKTWNNNGTTSIVTFKPVAPVLDSNTMNDNINNQILQKIDNLETKLNSLLGTQQQQVVNVAQEQSVPARKEVDLNAY